MNIYFSSFFIIATFLNAIACNAVYEQDAAILRKCLTQHTANGVNLREQWQKVTRYSEWASEEIPCLTRCIAHAKGWFDVEASSWHKQRIVDELGADMYNYCRYDLDRPFENACEFAHRGLRCLKQAEQYTRETYTTLLQCAHELGASMDELQKYGAFPAVEVVPCLFKCFAERMRFYTSDFEWNFQNWISAFGPVRYDDADSGVCKANATVRAARDTCAWMYDEYNCLERLNYNTDGSVSTTTAAPLPATTIGSYIKQIRVSTTTKTISMDDEGDDEDEITTSTTEGAMQ